MSLLGPQSRSFQWFPEGVSHGRQRGCLARPPSPASDPGKHPHLSFARPLGPACSLLPSCTHSTVSTSRTGLLSPSAQLLSGEQGKRDMPRSTPAQPEHPPRGTWTRRRSGSKYPPFSPSICWQGPICMPREWPPHGNSLPGTTQHVERDHVAHFGGECGQLAPTATSGQGYCLLLGVSQPQSSLFVASRHLCSLSARLLNC